MLLSELPQSLRDSPFGEGAWSGGTDFRAFCNSPCFLYCPPRCIRRMTSSALS